MEAEGTAELRDGKKMFYCFSLPGKEKLPGTSGPEDSPGPKQKPLCWSGEFPAGAGGYPAGLGRSCAPGPWEAEARQPEEALLWPCPASARPTAGTFPPGIIIISSHPEFFLQLCHVEEQPCGSAMICERVMNKMCE